MAAPIVMPARGAAQQLFEIQRNDALSPEAGGRIGGVSVGFPLWSGAWTIGQGKDVYDEWTAFMDSLDGVQNLFLAQDYSRPFPRAYPNGFGGLQSVLSTNNVFAGGVAGTPGTAPTGMTPFGAGGSFQLAFGTESGAPYMDVRFYGTAGVGGRIVGVVLWQKPAATNQAWTGGFDAKQTGGALPSGGQFYASLAGLDGTGGYLEGTNSASLYSTARQTLTTSRTLLSGSTGQASLTAAYYFPASAAYDVTARIYAPTAVRTFDGAAEGWTLGADRRSLGPSGLPAGFQLSRRDLADFRWTTGGEARRALVRFTAPVTANANGQVSSVSFRPALPGLVPANAVLHFDQPACLMRMVPSGSKRADIDRRQFAADRLQGIQELLA